AYRWLPHRHRLARRTRIAHRMHGEDYAPYGRGDGSADRRHGRGADRLRHVQSTVARDRVGAGETARQARRQARFGRAGLMARVTVLYFASLRDAAGVSSEAVESDAADLRALYESLRIRHGFVL